ncbi:MAG TPA: methyltransferase domain-containing protein [Thermodesulfobacteriota bacterium]
MRRLALGLLAVLLAACIQLPVPVQPPRSKEAPEPKQDAPYVGTPPAVVAAMLDLAEVTVRDVVYDLGSGDGRIVIAAARERGARGVGVEIDPALVATSRRNAERAGVADRVRFVEQDLFDTDLGEATVVTLYLSRTLNTRLMPTLLRDLRAGARIVSHDFDMPGWAPRAVRTVRGPYRDHRVYLWIVPPKSR